MTDRPFNDAFALSAMQESMLFSLIADPQSCLYLGQLTCDLSGPIDVPRIQSVWNDVIAAHPALRTTFVWEGLDQAVQVVHANARITVDLHDWSAHNSDDAETMLAQFLADDLATPFDLGSAPLMRVAVLSLPDCRTKMVWNAHHIIADGASAQNILKDFTARYNGHTPLTEPPTLRAVLEHRNTRNCAEADDFWRRYLGNSDPSATLTDPQVTGSGALWLTRALSPETQTALRAYCHDNKLTPATLLTGTWAILLSRFSHQDKVIFGLSMSGRTAPLPNLQAAVGAFMNTLPFVASLDEDVDVFNFLQGIQTTQFDLQAYDHSAQSDIKKAANLPAERPLYDTVVSINAMELPDQGANDTTTLTLSNIEVLTRSNQHMAFVPKLTSDNIVLKLSIDSSRFSKVFGETILEYLDHILRDIVVTRRHKLKDVAVSPVDIGARNPDLSRPATLHGLIEEAAKDNPNAIAVQSKTRKLSYREVLDESRTLAGRLQANGVKPGDTVGLMVHRSAEVPVGALGILMAGAAFVPLDPSYPARHIAHVLTDAAMTHLVLGTDCQTPEAFNGRVIAVDGPSAPYIPVDIKPDTLAYVLYTSGSTGRPKGVAVSHRNIVASNLARRTAYIKKPERFLLLSSFAFDSAFVGLFWPLIEGGTAIIPPPDVEKDIDLICAHIADYRATHTLCIPQLYQLILTHADPQDLASLTTVLVAGEPCPAALVEHHYQVLPDAQLHNEFGPTEGTIWCASAHLTPQHARQRVPIGRPSPACAVTIRDTGLRPLPDGVVGEICIAGPIVAQGYLNDEEKTRRAFVLLPDGERLYRTGDLGYVGQDNLLYFLGRKDEQVKIRGYRIEPAQIAATLLGLPNVREAVVIASTETPKEIAVEDLLAALGQMTAQEATDLIDQIITETPGKTQGAHS